MELMERQVLVKYKSLEFCYEPEITEDIEGIVRNTVLGSPTGLQYQHLDAVRKIHEIEPIDFFTLRREGVLNFVLALVERITHFKASSYFTYNVRYVSFNQKLAKKIDSDRKLHVQQRIGNSFIKEGMRKISGSFDFILKEGSNQPDKKIYYAFVEESNIRSMEFTQFFFEKIREVTFVSFCRLLPSKSSHFGLLKAEEYKNMKGLLDGQYRDYSFYFIAEGLFEKDYYILKEEGEVIIGAKIQEVNWRLVNVPGFTGKVLLRIIPFLPFFSRIIHQDSFRFLAIDHLYCKPGKEQQLSKFFESVLVNKKLCVSFLYFDVEDPYYKKVIDNIKRKGFLNRFYKGSKGSVLARFVNFTEEEKQGFFSHPVFISAYDMT